MFRVVSNAGSAVVSATVNVAGGFAAVALGTVCKTIKLVAGIDLNSMYLGDPNGWFYGGAEIVIKNAPMALPLLIPAAIGAFKLYNAMYS